MKKKWIILILIFLLSLVINIDLSFLENTGKLELNDFYAFEESVFNLNQNDNLTGLAISSNQDIARLTSNNNINLLASNRDDNTIDYLSLKQYCDTHDYYINKTANGYVIYKTYGLKRLIIMGDYSQDYSASQVVSYQDIHILQYSTEEMARYAHKQLLQDGVNVSIDTIVTISSYADTDYDYSAYKNWGAEALDIGGYREYLQSNNVTKQIVVAVMDTGINTAHNAFTNRLLKEGDQIVGYSYYSTNYTYSGYSFEDDKGHGTHVSGIICDLTPENVKIIPIRVLGSTGAGTTTNIIAGLQRVIDVYSNTYDIACVNMSLGGGYRETEHNLYTEIFNDLRNKNILPIVAAGNDNQETSKHTPASCDNAIVVSALKDSNDGYVFDNSYSNFGAQVDISAPGTQVKAAYIASSNIEVPNLYATLNGTSMATPQVAGAVALLCLDPKYIVSGKFSFTASQIESRLKETAIDMGAVGWDQYYGQGMVNLRYFAVKETTETITFIKDNQGIASQGEFIEYKDAFDLTISCSDSSYQIYYTLDNYTPNASNEINYSSSIEINDTYTIYAIGYKIVNGVITERTEINCISFFYNSGNLNDYFSVSYFGELTNYTGHFKKLTIPDKIDNQSVTGLGNSLFLNTEIESITLSEKVTEISGYAFQRCYNFHYLYAPGVTKLYKGAFDNCTSITNITSDDIGNATTGIYLPKLTTTKGFAFSNCTSLQNVKLENLTLQDTSIETANFAGCTSLIACDIPNAINIPKDTFFDCRELKTFYIGKNVTNIEDYAFYNCRLERISMSNENKYLYCDKETAVYNKDALAVMAIASEGTKYSVLDSVTINNDTTSITTIYTGLLRDRVLSELSIPSTITRINNIFAEGTQIGTLYFNPTALTCDGYVSYDDQGGEYVGAPFRYGFIEHLIIGSNVTTLPRRIFQQSNIKNLSILSSSTTYDHASFNASQIKTVVYLEFTDITSSWVSAFKSSSIYPYVVMAKAQVPNYNTLYLYRYWGYISDYYVYSVEGGKITATSTSGGSIAPEGEIVVCGGDCTFTIKANSGYVIKAVYVDDVNIGSVSTYTFNDVKQNHTIYAEFVSTTYNTYTISVACGIGGSITPANNIVVSQGGSQSFTITPNTGYRIKDVVVNGVSQGAISVYTFNNVQANQSIQAVFEKIKYNVNIICGANGTVSPSVTSVEHGANLTFTITPSTGYKIKEVKINNVVQSTYTTLTISNIQEDITFQVTFEIMTYQISVTYGDGGTVTPGTSIVNYGGSLQFSIKPNTGYKIKQVIVDGISQGDASSYTFSNVNANHSLQAVFEKLTFIITINCGENGKITPNTTSIEYGANITYTISPNDGYKIKDVKIDGVSVGAKSKYTFSNVTANHTISAEFSNSKVYFITVECDNATYQLDNTAEIIYGESRQISFMPNEGYKIISILVNGQNIGVVEIYTIGNIKENYEIIVNTEKIKFVISATCGENGQISPSGEIYVEYDDSIDINIKPNSGYSIDALYVDNVKIDNVSTYTFENIRESHIISVTFKLTGFLLNVDVIGNGSVVCSDGNGVDVGGNKIYTITPEEGWQVTSVVVDGEVKTLTDGKLILTDLVEPCDIKVEFRKIDESSTQDYRLGLILFAGLFIIMPLALITIYFVTSKKRRDRI